MIFQLLFEKLVSFCFCDNTICLLLSLLCFFYWIIFQFILKIGSTLKLVPVPSSLLYFFLQILSFAVVNKINIMHMKRILLLSSTLNISMVNSFPLEYLWRYHILNLSKANYRGWFLMGSSSFPLILTRIYLIAQADILNPSLSLTKAFTLAVLSALKDDPTPTPALDWLKMAAHCCFPISCVNFVECFLLITSIYHMPLFLSYNFLNDLVLLS